MPDEILHAQRRIDASSEKIFAILTDTTTHASIDGTGWVCEPRDTGRLTRNGQRFRMAMHHDQLPDKDYEMTNELIAFDAPHAIGWRPGQPGDDGKVRFGGWTWTYDLDAIDAHATLVTLSYDWSRATDEVRGVIRFPPFRPEYLDNSLDHLAELAT